VSEPVSTSSRFLARHAGQPLRWLAAVFVLEASAGIATGTEPEPAERATTIRVDRASFWYERLPRWDRREPWEVQAAPPGSSLRLERAVREVLAVHAEDFPLPPPLSIVVQAPPREDLETLLGYMANRTSYGGARLVGDVVYIDVNQSVFTGPDALNEAEIRAFLGHELVHAYQYGAGHVKLGHRQIWRREIEAYQWELANLEPGVRAAYRGDIHVNLFMYAEMLGD